MTAKSPAEIKVEYSKRVALRILLAAVSIPVAIFLAFKGIYEGQAAFAVAFLVVVIGLGVAGWLLSGCPVCGAWVSSRLGLPRYCPSCGVELADAPAEEEP